jgi:hypothetical protein
MKTLDRMEKGCGGSRADERGDNLSPDQAGFPDTRDDHPAFAGQDGFDGPEKTFIEPIQQTLNRLGFDANDFFGVAKNLFQEKYP